MFNSAKLFRKRLSDHIKELNRYMRYILNGHTAIALVFLISVLSVYYQAWLRELPPNFPASIIIAIIFGLLASWTPINTFLKEPDLVFITVSEFKMQTYFRYALIYSYFTQLYLVLLLVAALGPLYFHAFPEWDIKNYLLTLVILLIIKGLNFITQWLILKNRNINTHIYVQIIYLLLTIVLFFNLLEANFIIATVVTVLLFSLFIVCYYVTREDVGVNWELLIEKDQNRKQFFYRMASQFVDVPHLKSQVKRRRLLTNFVNKRSAFAQNSTYDYLYRLTFLRTDDYLRMYVRLIVIGGLFIYFVPNDWLKLVIGLLFIYMSNFQMITLFHHHRVIIWLDLYPVNDMVRVRSFISLLSRLTFIQIIIFSLIFILQLNFIFAVIIFAVGLLFNYYFNEKYVMKKIIDPSQT